MDTPQKNNVTVIPTGAALGADVVGVDLSKPLSDETFRQIEDAWHSHLVLRFRGQQLDDPALLAFGQRFGELDSAPIHAGKDVVNPFPQITVMSNIKVDGKPIGNLGHYEAVWHTDMSYNDLAPIGSLLYSLEVPPAGGNTGFSNMYKAWDTLPAALKKQVLGRYCRHDSSRNSAGELRKGCTEVTDPRDAPGAMHPLVRTHEKTHRNCLFLGRRQSAYIIGLPLDESERLLDELWAHASQPEFMWHNEWKVGDTLIWDNRALIHRRDSFDNNQRRMMHRVQIRGETTS
jgi:taurine dioxygenase